MGAPIPKGVGKPGSGLTSKEAAPLHQSGTNHPRNGMKSPGASVYKHMAQSGNPIPKGTGEPGNGVLSHET